MKAWTSLILLGLAIGSGLYIYFGAIKKEDREQARSAEEGRYFKSPPELYERIEILQARGSEIHLKRMGQRWFVDSPFQDLAASNTMEQILSSLKDFQQESILLRSSELKERQQDLDQYGLLVPQLKLRIFLTGEDRPQEITIGDKNPSGQSTYALDGQEGHLLLVNHVLDFLASYDPADYRENRLITVEADQFEELSLYAEGQQPIKLRKEDSKWKMLAPDELPLNQEFVHNQISRLAMIRATEFVSDLPALTPSDIRIEIGFQEGAVDRRSTESDLRPNGIELQLRKQRKAGRKTSGPDDFDYFAKSDKSLPASIARFHFDNFNKDYRAYVKTSFDDFSEDEIKSIRLSNFGELFWGLERSNGGWVFAGDPSREAPMKEAVDEALRSLRNLRAEHFMSRLAELNLKEWDYAFQLDEIAVIAIREFKTHQELAYSRDGRILKYSLREKTFDPKVWDWTIKAAQPSEAPSEDL
jgi:hypothetical protein